MGSTGEPDRKRRHLSSISPTAAAAAAKRHPLALASDDKKLDIAVLQYQNLKLSQQLEAQKAECYALDNKYQLWKEKQKFYDETLNTVYKTWEQLLSDLESLTISMSWSLLGEKVDAKRSQTVAGGPSCLPEDTFLCRLLVTGATDCCYANDSPHKVEDDRKISIDVIKDIIRNTVTAIDDIWTANDRLFSELRALLPVEESRKMVVATNGLEVEVKNLRTVLGDLHLKHRSLADRVRISRDTDAENKAELKHLQGELDSTIAELKEIHQKLSALKAQKNGGQGAFGFLNVINKHVGVDKACDKHRELQDMKFALNELSNLASNRLVELHNVHEERIDNLKKLANLQNALKDVKRIIVSKPYILLKDQIENSENEIHQCRTLLEKLQVEKDTSIWWEREANLKVDVADISHHLLMMVNFQLSELEKELQKRIHDRNLAESRLKDASKGPGRKEIIADFKALVSSLPNDMSAIQSQLSKYKEAASGIHSLRAEVQSLASILNRKDEVLHNWSAKSANQEAELHNLKIVVQDLMDNVSDLRLFLEMYKRESTDSRDLTEARDLEYKAWADVQRLQSALDEHDLELRVKAANEAEAISQQRLATAEAQIADLRQKLETSERDLQNLSEVLKSKHEEGEAYLSEIETIGQAYEDMQTQNQQLLQQITERDDYNIKLVLEGVKARQMNDALVREKLVIERQIHETNASLDLYDGKASCMEEQLKVFTEQVQRLTDEGQQKSVALANAKTKLSNVQKESYLLRQSLEESQSKVMKSRLEIAAMQIEVENERFRRKRLEDDLENLENQAARLSAHTDNFTLDKLQHEIREYREILKCTVCHDRQKEVVIAKCYHLFCNQCIQRTLGTRQRKCPKCGASFGHHDVKNVYI